MNCDGHQLWKVRSNTIQSSVHLDRARRQMSICERVLNSNGFKNLPTHHSMVPLGPGQRECSIRDKRQRHTSSAMLSPDGGPRRHEDTWRNGLSLYHLARRHVLWRGISDLNSEGDSRCCRIPWCGQSDLNCQGGGRTFCVVGFDYGYVKPVLNGMFVFPKHDRRDPRKVGRVMKGDWLSTSRMWVRRSLQVRTR